MEDTTNPITVSGGATVNGVQVDTQILMARKGYDKWPSANDGLKEWEDKVKAMDLADHKIPLQAITMHPQTGGLFKAGNKSSGLVSTKTALGHLVSYVNKDAKPDNLTNNLLSVPPAIRAQMLAYYIGKTQNRDVVLRTGLSTPDHRVIRAVVSEIHSQEKGDDLSIIQSLRDLVASAGPTAKLRVIRQWDYTSAELVIPTVAKKVGKGRTLYSRIQIVNSETKGGSYETLAGSMDLVCLNGMVAPGNSSTFKVRHMGDIGYRVRQSIKGAIDGAMDHLNTFAEAYETPLDKPRADILAAFGSAYELPESTVHAVQTLWDVDGEQSAGDTLAGLVNSITRYAQSQPVEQALETEKLAGEILHRGLSALI